MRRKISLTIALALCLAACSKEASQSRHMARAKEYFAAQEYEKAKIEFQSVLKTEPANADAIRHLGLIWSEEGAPLHALPFLLQTREVAPDDREVRMKLAQALLAQGQRTEARQEAETILKSAPHDGEALLLLAETARKPDEIERLEKRLDKTNGQMTPPTFLARATLELKKGDPAAAQHSIEEALAADPQSARAHLAQANLYRRNGRQKEAEKELQRAADLAPPRSAIRLQYGESLAQEGAAREAAQQLARLTNEAPDYLPAWNLRAKIALAERKTDEALALLPHVLNRDPMNFDARLLQAQARLTKGETKEALESLQTLDGVYRNVPLLKCQLARAYQQAGQSKEARAALEQALTLNPDFTEAVVLLGEMNLRENNPQPVLNAMPRLLEKEPGLAPARLLLAEALRATGRLQDAAKALDEQIRLTPENGRAWLLLGFVKRGESEAGEARDVFTKAEKLLPDDFVPTLQLAELDAVAGDFEQALARADRLIARKPDLAGAYFIKGRIFAARKDWPQARAALEKTLELDPGFAAAYDLLSAVYLNAGQLPEAIAQLNRLLEREPRNSRALLLIATLYREMEAPEKARDAYEKLLAAEPDSVPALNDLAWLYGEKLHDLDKACELARKARSLRPSDSAVADTLGWILCRRGQYEEAQGLLREAARSAPDNAEIQFHLGAASEMMNDKTEAKAALEKAARSEKPFAGKETIPDRLALLGGGGLSIDDLRRMVEKQPNDVAARLRLAEAYKSEEKGREEAAEYAKAFELNPRLFVAALELAKLFGGPLHDPAKALQFAKAARELAPDNPEVTGLLGGIACEGGDYAWAYSLLGEAVRALPRDAVMRRDLARASFHLGKLEEARRNMEQVIELSDDQAETKEAREFLRLIAQQAAKPADH